jgi:hypothetical protein
MTLKQYNPCGQFLSEMGGDGRNVTFVVPFSNCVVSWLGW